MITEQVIARISADTAGLKKGVAEANTSLRSLGTTAQRAGADANKGFLDMARGIKGVEKAANSAKSTMIGFIAATGAISMVQSAFNAAKTAVIDFNSTLEQANIGFTTMLGSAEAAGTYLKDLQSFAAKTPFQFTELIGASQRLMALGFTADKVQPMLGAVGDTVAALGGSMQDAGARIVRALGQMQAKGKVSAEEMMQLSEAGISAWKYLADAYGTTTADMMETSRKSVVDSSSAIKAILAGMKGDFGGMMEAQSKTLKGAMSNVVDYMEQTAGRMTLPIYERMRDAVLAISKFMGSAKFEQQSERIGKRIADGFDKGFATAGDIIESLREPVMSMFAAIAAEKDTFASIGDSVGELLTSLLKLATASASVFATMSAAAPKLFITAIDLAAQVVAELGEALVRYEGPLKVFLALFAATKIVGWTKALTAAATATIAKARAHMTAAAAVKAHTAAQMSLNASIAGQGKAQIAGMASGGIPGLATVQATKNLNLTSRYASNASKALGGLKAAGLGVLGAFTPMTAAITAFSVAALASAAYYTKVSDSITADIEKIVAGGDTFVAKIEDINAAIEAGQKGQGQLGKSDRDRAFEGGFWSDVGAEIGFAFSNSGFDDNTALDKAKDERLRILTEMRDSSAEIQDQAIKDAKEFVEAQSMEFAGGADALEEEFRKMVDAERQGFYDMLNPMDEFKANQQLSLDEIMGNWSSNLSSMQNWQANLIYLLQTGNADIAAKFMELGPMSNEALSSLIHGTPAKMDEFRTLLASEAAATGTTVEENMWAGLSIMPELAGQYGYDVMHAMTTEAQKEAEAAALKMPATFAAAFTKIKSEAGESIEAAYGSQASTEAGQNAVAALETEFAKFKPEDLFAAGVTAEALGIPEVVRQLAEMKRQGKDEPVELYVAAQEALREIGLVEEEVDALVNPPVPFDAQLAVDTKLALNDIDVLDRRINDVMTDRDIELTITQVWKEIGSQAKGWFGGTPSKVDNANGSIMTFANGGYLPIEAKIQSPGTLVQWAEPETGGEAFIPMNPNKRERSVAIWKEVGKRFGLIGHSFGSGAITKPDPWKSGTSAYGPSSSSSSSKSSGGSRAAAPGVSGFGWDFNYGSRDSELTGWQNLVKISMDDLSRKYEVGIVSTEYYLDRLKASLGSYSQYSDEWMSLTRQINSVEEELANERIARENNRYAVGDMSDDSYLKLLNGRIAGLEKYSDEWTAIWQEIQAVTERAAQEMAEHTDRIFNELAASFDAVTAPMKESSNLVNNLGGEGATTDQVAGYYAHMAEGLERWAKSIEQLKSAGLNGRILNDLIQAGPASLPFAESLLKGGASMINTINQGQARVDDIIGGFGLGQTSVGVSGTTVNVGDVQITIGEGSTLNASEVKAALLDALEQLADYVETGVKS